MKIFPVNVISQIDAYTIENEPILSINLMERASRKLFEAITEWFMGKSFVVVVGPGNNGGDALALSRMLLLNGFDVVVVMLQSDGLSKDATINRERLGHIQQAVIINLDKDEKFPEIKNDTIIVDGLFGSGLNRPLQGEALKLVKHINSLNAQVVSIDIPSGLMGEDNSNNNNEGIIKATITYTFQFPKLAFLFPENGKYVGEWRVLPIGLHPEKIMLCETNWHLTTHCFVKEVLPKRHKFFHKGNAGHVLLVAGSYGKMGAAVLASRACLRSGAGLLTVQVPHATCCVMHTAVPEAMVNIDRSDLMFTEFPVLEPFDAIGVGPAIGIRSNAIKALSDLFDKIGDKPLVLDADAINIISSNPVLLKKLPQHVILTPHPGEFERLVGKWNNDFHRLQMAVNFAVKYKVVLVLKGAYTTVVNSDGVCYFNSTGNPGMATAGSGDALTGIVLAMLGRGLAPLQAAILGVYIHGLAGDFARDENGEESLIASDIIANLGAAFKALLQ